MTHQEQLITLLEAYLTGYTYVEGGIAPSFFLYKMNPVNDRAFDGDVFSLHINATTIANLETIGATLKQFHSNHPSGYEFATEAYPLHIEMQITEKYNTNLIATLTCYWGM